MGIELGRPDIKAIATAALAQVRAHGDANAHVIRERAESRDTLYLHVERAPSKQGQPDRYRATCIAGLPAGKSLVVHGSSIDDCLFEARHELLNIYWLDRMPADTSADIRDRVHRTHLSVISGDT